MGYMVSDKVIPADLLLADASLSELYAEDKLSRKSSFNLLRSLLTAVESLWPNATFRLKLTSSVCVRALDSLDEKRVKLSNGSVYVADRETDDVRAHRLGVQPNP